MVISLIGVFALLEWDEWGESGLKLINALTAQTPKP
jgi:hypothetical protein